MDDLELERVAAAGWPGLETRWLGDWRLRAGRGFTGRANSALPLGSPGRPVGEALTAVAGWYGQRGLPAMLQVPLPVRAELVRPLEDAGFVRGHGARVLTASVSSVAEAVRTDLPAIEWAAAPDDGWLSLYHYRGGDLPDSAVPVLVAGADVRFGTLRIDGAVAGICRTSSASGWLGLTAVEVSPVFRRQGLATHLLRSAAARTDAEGVYLQVEHGNATALALYARCGFTVHHEYFYWRLDAL
ncbi:GNAT family N-acetyltransferase [Fodinicola feengrottensis]|uniref:GNAT family N-acetyltransferase n=1 Tax=Fodinicola feengrottensis TaxID=435914 RepID=UPI0031D523D3